MQKPEIETLSALTLQRATLEQKPALRQLLELYQYDFSEFSAADVDENGLYGYPYLDHYWVEPNRHPILFKMDEKLAGFALVRTLPALPKAVFPVHSMAEFFVLKKYRRRGIGREAAFRLFSMFPGEWHVTQQVPNLPAQYFWRKVIREYTRCNYHEKVDVEGGEVVQKFLSTKGYSERVDG